MKYATPNGTHKGNSTHWIYKSIALALFMLVGTSGAAPFAYIANFDSNTVSVIDIATNTVTATVPVGFSPVGVDVTPDGTRAYVTNFGSNTVSVINTATNTVTATVIAGSGAHGVAVAPDGIKAYVTNFYSNTVSVINTATNTVTATVPVGSSPAGIAITPDGTKAYVANWDTNSVPIINTATNTVIATVPVGSNSYGVAVAPDGTKAYVANWDANIVSVINTATNTITATVPVGSTPTGVAVTPDGTKAYVANRNSNTVSVINTAVNAVTATVPVGSAPYSMGKFISPSINTPSETLALSVSKAAQVNGKVVQQVNPGQTFSYNVTITNKDLANDAQEVVITDKLPYDVEYLAAVVYPTAPADYSINQSGDLVYVRFDQIPAASTRYINITVKAPTNAPTTLYNIVNLRYRKDMNQSDNRMTLATYVPQLGYNQTLAAFSFEDLLHNQSQLLFQFEDLLHTIPSNSSTNYSFLVSFEQLLRSQAALTSSFEDLLSNESSTGWDVEYSEENRTALLWSYEQMLYDEAFLFASFNAKLNESWNSLCGYTKAGHTQDAQTELVASFEDLLKRQTRLYKSFNLLLNKIDISSHQDMVDFLAAYENLLRVEANLLMSFNELLETKCSYSAYVCSQGCEYSSIQAAVDAANPGDIIYIAEGIYKENVHIDKSLTIKGADANATIIDGKSAGTVIDIGRNNPNTDVTLSGMTILDGSGTITDYYGNGDPQLCGGGISNFGSTNINDCNIGTPANPNTAKYGGGISNFGTLTVTNSNISGNQVSSQGAGGAIFNHGDQAQMTITDSTIFDNLAYWGAGIWTADGAAATVIRCKILNNYAFYNGGGICNAASSLTTAPINLLNVIDSQISGNYAGFYGGGIDNSGATSIVTASAITGNQAGIHGGGVTNKNYWNGVDDIPATITLTNNRISENTASVGGGIYGSGALLPDPFDWTQVYNNSPPP